MTFEQLFLLGLLAVVFVLFVWGPLRYDVVAFLALLAATAAGTVPAADAFVGFGHPATVTVATVLVISRALSNSGAVDLIARHLIPPMASASRQVGAMAGVAGALSAVMNNVGALALLMPASLQSAAKAKHAPALILMPLSFGSILGGLVTLIGTPPNIIVAAFRQETAGAPFGMFDFTPVGGVVAVAGIAFVALVGWRLIPPPRRAKLSPRELFELEDYVSEVRVPKEAQAVGRSLGELDDMAGEHDAVILRLIRRNRRIDGRARRETVRAGDVLVVEAGPEALGAVMAALQLKPVGAKADRPGFLVAEDVAVAEAVVQARARIVGRTGESLRLRRRHGVTMLAVSRQGRPFRGRLKDFRFRAGDVLLLEGEADQLPEVIAALGCLPLAERRLQVGTRGHAGVVALLFGGAIGLAAAGV